MLPGSCFCEDCREIDRNHTGFDIQDDQWLEEMGEMIWATVEGMRKEQPFTVGCYERLATT